MIDTYVRCNSVIVHNDANDGDDKQIENKRQLYKEFWECYANEPIRGRNLILASFCPEVCIRLKYFQFICL